MPIRLRYTSIILFLSVVFVATGPFIYYYIFSPSLESRLIELDPPDFETRTPENAEKLVKWLQVCRPGTDYFLHKFGVRRSERNDFKSENDYRFFIGRALPFYIKDKMHPTCPPNDDWFSENGMGYATATIAGNEYRLPAWEISITNYEKYLAGLDLEGFSGEYYLYDDETGTHAFPSNYLLGPKVSTDIGGREFTRVNDGVPMHRLFFMVTSDPNPNGDLCHMGTCMTQAQRYWLNKTETLAYRPLKDAETIASRQKYVHQRIKNGPPITLAELMKNDQGSYEYESDFYGTGFHYLRLFSGPSMNRPSNNYSYQEFIWKGDFAKPDIHFHCDLFAEKNNGRAEIYAPCSGAWNPSFDNKLMIIAFFTNAKLSRHLPFIQRFIEDKIVEYLVKE